MTRPTQPARRVLTDMAERRQTRTESLTQIRRGDIVGTRWEIVTTVPADPAPVYPRPVDPGSVSRRWRWQLLLLAAVGAVAVVAGMVWAVLWLLHALVVVVAAVWPTLVGLLIVAGLLAVLFSGGGGCPGLHCGGCRRH